MKNNFNMTILPRRSGVSMHLPVAFPAILFCSIMLFLAVSESGRPPRYLVLSEGRLTATFSRAEATEQKIMEAATLGSRKAG